MKIYFVFAITIILQDKNTESINVRTTSEDDVLIIYIRARGIDEIELKIKKATTVALSFSFNKLLIPNFDDVPDDC